MYVYVYFYAYVYLNVQCIHPCCCCTDSPAHQEPGVLWNGNPLNCVLLFGHLLSWWIRSNTSGQRVSNCLWRQGGSCWLLIPVWAWNKPFGKQVPDRIGSDKGMLRRTKTFTFKNPLHCLGQSQPKRIRHVSLLSLCVLTAAAVSNGRFGCPSMSSVWPLCEAGSKVLWS